MSTEGSKTSNFTLRKLAENAAEDFDCMCDGTYEEETAGTKDCPCAGDECWHCAALMALANDESTVLTPATTTPATKEP